MSDAAPVMSSVPTTAGPIPPPGRRSMNGRSSVRNSQLMTLDPCWITYTTRNTSGTIAMRNASEMKIVATTFLALRERDFGKGDRRGATAVMPPLPNACRSG